MNIGKVKGLDDSLAGTFIADVLGIMETQSFLDIATPPAEGEKVVGEMDAYEKALYAFADKCGVQENEIINRFRAAADGQAEIPAGEEAAMIAHIESIGARYKVARKLLWDSLNARFAAQSDERATGKGIRNGFKVVLLFKQDNETLRYCSLLGGFQ